MDRVEGLARQFASLLGQVLPQEIVPSAVVTALLLLILGVGVSVLGAKFARWLLSIMFAVGGLILGLRVTQMLNLPIAGALVGGLVVGCVGYLLHRLWVGMAAACLLASLAFSLFSVQYVLPRLDALPASASPVELPSVEGELEPLIPQSSQAALDAGWRKLKTDAEVLAHEILDQEPRLRRVAGAVVLIAGGVGLLMGIMFCRMTLILITSALGTLVIMGGIVLLGPAVGVDAYQSYEMSPHTAYATTLSFFVVSVVLQWILTRSTAVAPVSSGAGE